MNFQCANKEPWRRWFEQAEVQERLRSNWERRRKERWRLGFRFTGNHQLGLTVFLRHRCLILCSPSCSAAPLSSAHATDGKASGKEMLGIKQWLQRHRAKSNHRFPGLPTKIRANHLPSHERLVSSCFFFHLAKSLFHSPRKCRWTFVQGLWKEERHNVYCAFSIN